jgi:hypothetical protein
MGQQELGQHVKLAGPVAAVAGATLDRRSDPFCPGQAALRDRGGLRHRGIVPSCLAPSQACDPHG